MNRDQLALRTRATLDQWFVLVVVVLLAVAAFGGWMAYSAHAAEPEPDQQTVEVWSTTAGYQHSAEVQVGNPVFEAGETLEDRPIYYTRLAPELEAAFHHRYDGAEGDVDVTIDLEQVIRSVDGDGGEYWSTSEPLNATQASSVEPGEGQSTAVTLSVPELVNETEMIDSSFGDTPGDMETVVVASVTMEGTIDGEEVRHTEAHELVLEPDGDTYSVDAPRNERHTEERTVTTESDEAAAGLSDMAGGIVLLLASSAALGGLTVAKHRGTLEPTEADVARVAAHTERERFDEWITLGVVPDAVLDRPRVGVDTLEGLVDVAIDTDNRVLEERGEDGPTYWVLEDDLVYVYEPVEPVLEEVEELEDDHAFASGGGGGSPDIDTAKPAPLTGDDGEAVSNEDD